MRASLPEVAFYHQRGPEPRLKFSAVDVDQVGAFGGVASLVVSQYGDGDPAVIAHFPVTSDGRVGNDGWSSWEGLTSRSITNVQGGVSCNGTYYLNRSRGTKAGTLYVTGPALEGSQQKWLVGPEDTACDSQQGRLWSLGEHPGKRLIAAYELDDL
jgi:hypothetical protein